MDSSRRAVESYWRSRMVDGATSDEDKVAPVYKLEEICDLLRSSHVSIVKEVSDFVLKRLDHKSPLVKQKALRLIKYCVGKSGPEFRREMQRNSAAVRQLFHYKGQPDALKGDALNKAVRDTAHETISAIFSEENKPEPTRDINKRIEGFGNTNFEMPSEDRKSFLSEVVGLGSASIKQGLSTFAQGQSARKNETGSYKSPNLRRSLTLENDNPERYEPARLPNETQYSFGGSKNVAGGSWGPESRSTNGEARNGDSSSSFKEGKTREERLLETIVTSGGVRLQPARDAIQVFLVEAAKLDALALTHALESKLQSPMWQVRLKAVCVLESVLRRKEDAHFSIIASYFGDNRDPVVKCSESPQTSLREKANRVLDLLGGELGSNMSSTRRPEKVETAAVHIPDLIDTGYENDFFRDDSSIEARTEKRENPATTTTPFVDDLLGDNFGSGFTTREEKNDEDPFADVSFHAGGGREQIDDLFSGMTFDDKSVGKSTLLQEYAENHVGLNNNQAELFDIFGSSHGALKENANHKSDFNDLMGDLSSNENIPVVKKQEVTTKLIPEAVFSDSGNPSHQSNDDANLGSQITGMSTGPMFPPGTMPISMAPGMVFNPAFSQPFNYNAMGAFLAQQQLLATMANLQNLNNLNGHNVGAGHNVTMNGSGNASPLPDIFHQNLLNQVPSSTMNTSKKEYTRAFDFISDHVAAARDPKRLL